MPETFNLPVNYRPREYQKRFWAYMEGGGLRYAGAWHRRAGKDHTVFSWIEKASFQRKGLYWHVLPTYEQGRKIIWNGMTGDGTRFIDLFPRELIKRKREDAMLVELVNGSIYQVVGGDDPDRLRGASPVGVVFSEYAFFPTAGAWDVVRPILQENGGWAVFISTPQGRNHFHDIYEHAVAQPEWFAERLTVNDTRRDDGRPVITPEAIEEELATGMSKAMVDQEYFCSFDSPFEGAIYGDEIRAIQGAGRGTTECAWDPGLPVRTWWDIGINDPGAVWFVQRVGRNRHFIDYHQQSDWSMEDWIRFVLNKPYIYEGHVGPWDLEHREATTGDTRASFALKYGLRFEIAGKDRIENRITATRSFLRRMHCVFDHSCRVGVEALAQYRWKRDKQGLPTKVPHHDLHSHGADAFGTGVMMDDVEFNYRQVTGQKIAEGAEYDVLNPSSDDGYYTDRAANYYG